MNNAKDKRKEFTVGIISDTHGLLRPGAVEALEGSDLILHAGDVGDSLIIDNLRATAPVVAVRGNMDTEAWSRKLKLTEVIEEFRHLFYLIHDLNRMDIDPAVSGMSVVINGHTHRALIERYDGVLYINPGSAGPVRYSLPPSVARLYVKGRSLDAEIIELKG